MADFSVNATQLSAPQGAGAVPVAPVQQQYISSGIAEAVSNLGDIFAKGLSNKRKEEADARKKSIVNGYVSAETAINNAVASGQMSAQEAAARSRANANKYYAGYSDLIPEFEAAGKALRGFTEKGEVEAELQTEKDIFKADINQARERGFIFTPGMSRAAADAQIRAAKTSISAEREMEQLYKKNAEQRAQGTYDAGVAQREARDVSTRLINAIAGDNLEAFQQLGSSLAADVKSGKITYDEAQRLMAQRYSNIASAIQAGAGVNPELAAPYRSIFEDMNKLYITAMDPKQTVDNLDNQVKLLINKQKLIAVSNPQLAAGVALSQLFGQSADIILANGALLTNAARNMIEGQADTPIVGNPNLEKDGFRLAKDGLTKLQKNSYPDNVTAKGEIRSYVNGLLGQMGDMLGKGNVPPAKLKESAAFVASPEYAYAVTNGVVDAQSAQVAKQVFQLNYEPTIIRGVQQKLTGFLDEQAVFNRNEKRNEPVELTNVLNIKFTGSGVIFEPVRDPSLTASQNASQAAKVKDLQQVQTAINQVIHMGAHLEGSTDYKKYWEENKHVYFPDTFPNPDELKVGDVKNGYQYLGGAYRAQRSWKRVE